MRVHTDCETCDSTPWPSVSPEWKLVGEEPGIADWARNLQVRRCPHCGRYWATPYDQYNDIYDSSSHPLGGQLADLLRPGAGAAALSDFLDGQGIQREDGCSVVQSYLLNAAFDFGVVLGDLIARLPTSGGQAAVRPLRLIEDVLSGESGRRAWLSALRGVHGLPVPRTSVDKLHAAVDRMSEDSSLMPESIRDVSELRRLLSRWRRPQ